MKLFKVTPSPFIKRSSTSNYLLDQMLFVMLALVVVGVVFSSVKALIFVATAVLSAFLFELFYNFIVEEKKGIENCSCVITALVYCCIADVNTPFYASIIAMFFAIVIVKMVFGGYANNMFNPAASGAIIVSLLFGDVTRGWVYRIGVGASAYPNGIISTSSFKSFNLLNNLLGQSTNTLGTICAVAVLAGAAYLLIMQVVNFKIPLTAIIAYLGVALIYNNFNYLCLLPYLFSGIVLFVIFFMLPDYTTSPNTTLGQIIYAIIFGVLAAVFVATNVLGNVGVLFALIIANSFTPLLDRVIRPKYFGEGK